ncbi:MAG TPA: cellulase family glycosylhydrolase, partial [Polyangiaceae bacterium]
MNARRTLVVAVCLAAVGCDERFADPIGGPPSSDDPCARWTSEAQCRADVSNACSVQPNPVGCRSDDPDCPESACVTGDPFVRRNGAALTLRGRSYRFAGTNSWGVAFAPDGCKIDEAPDAETAATRVFDDLAELGVGVLRVWAFQSYAGSSGTDYSAFERLVVHARRAGVRLVFVLENQWDDCTKGARNDDWFRTGYTASYNGYALSYVDYVEHLVEHFQSEPTILAWELMHEAGGDDFAALNAFVQDMTTRIRVRDPNHLIAIGVNNGYSPSTSNEGTNSNYAALHAHSTVDLVDVHDFDTLDQPLTEGERIDFGIASALGKPAFVGAMAVLLEDESSAAFSQRANGIRAKLDSAYALGFAGALVYDYYPGWSTPSYSFDSRSSDPLGGPAGVV